MLQLSSVPRLYISRLITASLLVYISIYVYSVHFISSMSIVSFCPSNSTSNVKIATANPTTRCLARRHEIAIPSLRPNSSELMEPSSYNATKYPPPQDVAILLDNADICRRSASLKYIFYVHSSPENADRRELLRTTWLDMVSLHEHDIAWIFLLGRSEIPSVNEQVKAEAATHGDIILGDFIDNYRNLTIKAVMGLKWIATHCSRVRFAIKADDDTFVNANSLLYKLKLYEGRRKLILCSVWEERTMPILRNRSSCMKWCVDEDQFPGKRYYPRYCAGLSFVISGDLVPLLYKHSKATPYFWIDDVYVTGLLPLRVQSVQFVNIVKNSHLRRDVLKGLLAGQISFNYLFLHLPYKEEYSHVWKLFLGLSKNATIESTDIMI